MDVTFTNVLEGARQYFQGLPAATGSAASPSSSAASYGSASVGSVYTAAAHVDTSVNNAAGQHQAQTHAQAQSQSAHARPAADSAVPTAYWSTTATATATAAHDQTATNTAGGGNAGDTTTTTDNVIQQQQQPQQYTHQQDQLTPSHNQSITHNNPPTASHSHDPTKPQQTLHSYHYQQQSQQQQQQTNSQSYQFSRPQSHDAASSVVQYSSHYSQRPSQPGSHHVSQSPLQHMQQSQPRPPSRHDQMPSSPKTQSYHQLQPPRHHTPSSHAQTIYLNNFQQQAKSYYPTNSQTQTSHPASTHSYQQPAASQTYMPTQYSSYSPHSHSPVQTQYLSTKPVVQHASYENTGSAKADIPGHSSSHLPTSQHHRTTHNLPPIAALSSVNYHSNKSNRETIQRLANHRHRTQSSGHGSGASLPTGQNTTASVPVASTMTASTPQQQPRVSAQYSQQTSNQFNATNYTPSPVSGASSIQHGSSANGATYPYIPTSSQPYTCTTTSSTSSSASTSSNAPVYNQSSYVQHYPKLAKVPYQQDTSSQKQTQYQSSASKDYQYQSTPNSSRALDQTVPNTANQLNRTDNSNLALITAKQKRESPLDLSVKTVRTSADSTALDDSDVHSSDPQRLNKSYPANRSMPPPMQVPGGTYIAYDHHANTHHRNANMRSTQITSAGAPKVDFLPNFNVPSLHHSQRSQNVDATHLRQQQQQSDKNHNATHVQDHNSQNKYARNMYNNKLYYPQHSSQHGQVMYQHNYNNNTVQNSVQQSSYISAETQPKRTTENLPRIDFPTPGHNNKTNIYASSTREVQRKRMGDTISTIPSKIPKMDSWRQTIDQQIEQRLSSYANSRKQQEQLQQQQQQQPQQHQQQQSQQQLQTNQQQHQQNIQQLHPQQRHQHQTQQSQHVQYQQYPHIHQKQHSNATAKPLVNGNTVVPNHHNRAREMYIGSYPQTHQSYQQTQQPFNNTSNQYHSQTANHSQTYVPTAVGQHHYPTHANHQNHPQTHDMYQQNVLSRTNSNPKLTANSPVKNNNVGGAADKRVLSILRNSLEIKGAKEAQKKLEQIQLKPQEIHANHIRSGVQQPTTDVTAPLQPKPGIVGRHNVSPFTAASLLERNSTTPPIYKFHFPRAVDSVRFEPETITKDNVVQATDKLLDKQNLYPLDDNIAQNNSSSAPTGASSGTNDLDGLAAFIASRIRTKAELKQVGTSLSQSQNTTSNTVFTQSETASTYVIPITEKTISYVSVQNNTNNNVSATGASPPKLTRERGVLPPRRRLFSRSEEEPNVGVTVPSGSNTCVPPRDTALRSSSETSVFDFRDSDSEGEMPVLERQSLDDMRRDRKSLNKPQQPTFIVEKEVAKVDEHETPDFVWSEACDKFLDQLKSSDNKKPGRRKKVVEPDVLAKLETVTKEKPLDINLDVVVKLENIALLENKTETSVEETVKTEEQAKPVKAEDDSDSDVPLIRRKNVPLKVENMSDGEDSNLDTKKEKIGAKVKIEYSSESSDSESETVQAVSDKLRTKKEKENYKEIDKDSMVWSADSSPAKKINSLMKKKTIFGDGSHFRPGWEAEVYKYKQALRMPRSLICITKAPHVHRVSTSLPDLDPCSPAPSSLTDDTEFSTVQRRSLPNNFTDTSNMVKLKRDNLDSDMDSNSSFSFIYQKASYDSEEASCSSLKLSPFATNTRLKSKENNNSIVDVLVQKFKPKRKRTKGKEQKPGPKIIPKSSEPLELLPTPSLGIGTPEKDTKPGRGKAKNNKEKNKCELNDSVYLGFFRKQTVSNFRDTFKKNSSSFMGLDEQFSPLVFKSRTRTETRILKQQATIREVFGEERPASAPPIACREDENSQDSVISEKKVGKSQSTKLKEAVNSSPSRPGLRSSSRNKTIYTKKLQRGRKRGTNLLKVLTSKKINSELPDEKNVIKSETPSVKSETPSIDGEESSEVGGIPTKKRLKFRNMRRKFSSGFDYIRKKKKQVKKETGDADTAVKPKRRGAIPRPSPESVQDIQREIKTWVMNKGVGETHLHRAARLGYTDVTAYCLEKLDCIPSPKDNAGYTPLHEACSRGHLDIARILLQYGANVSESAQGGIRPLHEAAENGYVEITRLLLSFGADPMLATYSGLTPLSLATDEETKSLLKHYMADMQGLPAPPWSFIGPAQCFDPEESGYDPLENAPSPEPVPDDEDIEIEMSEQQLPNLYTLRGESPTDRWVLLQDLSMILKIKSRDTLLRQISSTAPSTSTSASASASTAAGNAFHKSALREMKFSDFLEQARCCQLLCANEKLNIRSSKIALVKYTEKVKQLLGMERVVVTSR